MVRLARRRIDPRYANPWDVALAVYVWALDLKDSPLRIMGAGAAIETLGAWWARKVAEEVLTETAARSDAPTEVYEPVFEPIRNTITTEEYDAFFIADYSIPFIWGETEVQFLIPREDVENPADDETIIHPGVSFFSTSTTSGTQPVQRVAA
jgi:hypothetical protein